MAVLFVNYGPYHRARGRALAAAHELEPYFVELASAQALYPWHDVENSTELSVTTLARGQYERLPKARITRALWRCLDHLDPAVVVGCGYRDPPMLAAAVWARRRGRRFVLMFETTEWDRPRPVWEELPKRWLLGGLVDAVFCGGTAHRQYLRKLGVPEARIWEKYDVVDNAYFARASSIARAKDDRARLGVPGQYLLYVGRFSPEKNLTTLLHAYAHYRQQAGARCGLVLVGDGPTRQHLRQLAAQLDLQDVVFAGQQDINSLPGYYAFARAFVLPSTVEPWGLVVNEAMACGLPVLVSDRCGCARDLVRPADNGWTFHPSDVDSLANHMLALDGMSAAERAHMGDASRAIVADYTPQAWAGSLSAACTAVATRVP